jgi:Ca2+-binding EF-hand superfamily protein
MLMALGAVSTALDVLQSLTSPKSSSPQSTGFGQSSRNSFDVTGNEPASGSSKPPSGPGGGSQISPATMGALLAAQSQTSMGSNTSALASQSASLKDLFSQIHAGADGNISKSEFESALGAGGTNIAQTDDVFSKLDKNGDGSVSLDEMSSALKGRGHHRHAHVAAGSTGGADGSNSDSLLQALQGASSTSVTNSDGSTTTSVTYADGSKVTMTSPAATTAASTAASSYNVIERMIAREAQAIASSTASLPVSV